MLLSFLKVVNGLLMIVALSFLAGLTAGLAISAFRIGASVAHWRVW